MKVSVIALAILSFLTFSRGADFYDIATINDVYLYFEQNDRDASLDQLMAQGQEERLLGRVLINGEEYDSVGVRYKGNSSYSANRVKNPLDIKLDYVMDRKHDG